MKALSYYINADSIWIVFDHTVGLLVLEDGHVGGTDVYISRDLYKRIHDKLEQTQPIKTSSDIECWTLDLSEEEELELLFFFIQWKDNIES